MARTDKPEDQFGPHMDWREHSFLRNARMPADVKRSRVRVSVCQPADDPLPCSDGGGRADEVRGRVHLRPGLTDEQLTTALQVSGNPGSSPDGFRSGCSIAGEHRARGRPVTWMMHAS